jgi:hypothetical protein
MGLEPHQTATFETLVEAFKRNYYKSPQLRWVESQKMYAQPQRLDETVNDFVIRLKKTARQAQADKETVKSAFLAGLRPSIRSQVLMRGAADLETALETARLAEASGNQEPLQSLLQDQIRLSTKAAEKQSADLMSLAARVEKLAVAVATTTETLAGSVNAVNNRPPAGQQTTRYDGQRQDNYAPRQPRATPQNQQRINYGREAEAQGRVVNEQPDPRWQNQTGHIHGSSSRNPIGRLVEIVD